ncbi:MAG: OmpA family protein [Desulfosudaceae bacterium]
MKNWLAGLLVLSLSSLLTFQAVAETIVLKSGDVLKGKIRTESFQLHTPYGGIAAAAEDIKTIESEGSSSPGVYSLLTVNNDIFSGRLFPSAVEIDLSTGESQTIDMEDVKRILFTFHGPTRTINTTLFFMNNDDLFAADLLNETISIQTDQDARRLAIRDLSRLEFYVSDKGLSATALLNDGTSLAGRVLKKRLNARPTSVSLMTLCATEIRKIQFRARQKVLINRPSLTTVTYDSDGDNVPDDTDQCPETACNALVDNNGCERKADRDDDGVLDTDDLCPQTPSGLPVDDAGCWSTIVSHFDFDRARLQPEDIALLDQVKLILARHPDMPVNIQGHTDSLGSKDYNRRLSQRRAQSVKDYLVDSGISPDRLNALGYGETRPVATNETEAGRARNRRVVLIEARP